jgi:hypothetical protein
VTARRAITDAVGLAVLAGVALVVVSLLVPSQWRLALDAYLLCVGALALMALTRVIRFVSAASETSEFEAALHASRSRRRPEREPQLPTVARLEREVTLATANAFDFHVRLRPTFREIAEHRLFDRYGIALDGEPERASAILGPDVWELVRPDRPPPRDRHSEGLPAERLRHAVETLEGA